MESRKEEQYSSGEIVQQRQRARESQQQPDLVSLGIDELPGVMEVRFWRESGWSQILEC